MRDIICPLCGASNTIRELRVEANKLVMDDDGSIILADQEELDETLTRWECSSCKREVDSDDVSRIQSTSTGWIIRKRSRAGVSPYSGPTLRNLNLEPRVYFDKEDAVRVAALLGEHNPVGFDVVKVRLVEVKE